VYEGGQSGLTYKIRIRAESNADQMHPEVILNGRENEPHLSRWTWKDKERVGRTWRTRGKTAQPAFLPY